MRQRYRTLADYFEQTRATHESLADELGLTRPYISMIASGARQPSLNVALRIQSLTGVPVESLVSRPQVAS